MTEAPVSSNYNNANGKNAFVHCQAWLYQVEDESELQAQLQIQAQLSNQGHVERTDNSELVSMITAFRHDSIGMLVKKTESATWRDFWPLLILHIF